MVGRVLNSSDTYKRFQISQPEGQLWLDKISLTELQPMSIIHMDIFKYEDRDYVLMRVQLSTFIWFSNLPTTDTSRVLKELDGLQENFGCILKICSDREPQFLK